MNKFVFLKKIDLKKYIYLNYLCKSVERKNNAKIIPYKHAVVELEKGSKIIVNGDIEIGTDLIKGSKAETRVRLRENAVWNAEESCSLSYGTTLEVLQDGVLNTKYFTMNSNCTMIAAKEIKIGHDVMIGRNVTIYDSDYHSILDETGNVRNHPIPVHIGNRVWIGTNSMVLKGSHIGDECILAANSFVPKSVGSGMIYHTQYVSDSTVATGSWSRKSC